MAELRVHQRGCACDAERFGGENEYEVDYFVDRGEGYVKVSRAEWMQAEHDAGFYSKFPGHPATAGFSTGTASGLEIRGAIRPRPKKRAPR